VHLHHGVDTAKLCK